MKRLILLAVLLLLAAALVPLGECAMAMCLCYV